MPVLDSYRLGEGVLNPRNVLEHRRGRVPVGQMHMHLPHVSHMGDYRQTVGVRSVRDLDVFGDAGKTRHVGLNVLNRTGADEVVEGLK